MKILITDDHALFRAGLRSLLSQLEPACEVLEAGDPAQAIDMAVQHRPDVVFMDIAMPGGGGLPAVERIKQRLPQTRVLMLSMHLNPEYVRRALAAGADGYLLKDSPPSELQAALRAARDGAHFLSPPAASTLIEQTLPAMRDAHPLRQLTGRQVEVLCMIAKGLSTKEMARELDLSPKTVEIHRAQVMSRLGLHDVASLTRFAVKVGLVDADS